MIATRSLCAGYRETTVLADIDLLVQPRSTLAVVGRSGSGKSTLLSVLAGLITASTGAVLLDGSPLTGPDRRVGLVMQSYGLFPWFTVARNVEMGLRIRARTLGKTRPEDRSAAERALAGVGLAGKVDAFPRELSGGEQQRVALARTLVLNPRILLLDEPFSSLDALAREELQDVLLGLLASAGTATILVTHSIEEAVFLGDSIGILAGCPARLEIRPNAAGPHAAGPRAATFDAPDSRRIDPEYLRACADVRAWFRETTCVGS